jgi:hypothetical protein
MCALRENKSPLYPAGGNLCLNAILVLAVVRENMTL